MAGDPTTPQDSAEPLDNTQNTVSSSTCWIYRLGSCVCLQNWQMLYELELSSQCSEQPDLVDEEVNATTGAVLNTNLANRRECNTWYCSPHSSTPLGTYCWQVLLPRVPLALEPHQLPGPLPHLQVSQVRQVHHRQQHQGGQGQTHNNSVVSIFIFGSSALYKVKLISLVFFWLRKINKRSGI